MSKKVLHHEIGRCLCKRATSGKPSTQTEAVPCVCHDTAVASTRELRAARATQGRAPRLANGGEQKAHEEQEIHAQHLAPLGGSIILVFHEQDVGTDRVYKTWCSLATMEGSVSSIDGRPARGNAAGSCFGINDGCRLLSTIEP